MEMAESQVTKRALADALEQELQTVPYGKISVGSICAACGMSRKCFYYHFRDKEDLVNWIFDEDVRPIPDKEREPSLARRMGAVSRVLYERQQFYRKMLKTEGQNCLSQHLRAVCVGEILEQLDKSGSSSALRRFQAEFCADFFVCALKRWLDTEPVLPPEAFIAQMEASLKKAAAHLT
jgi:AcrR family transcriptional regulator